MKKILLLLSLIIIPFTLWGQPLNGDGSSGNPFNGTFGIGDVLTWSGTIYVNGDIIVDNEQLTISAGATIIFTTTGADLIITGTGQLTADGTPSSKITFTKGTGNSFWGHISFQSMGAAGASLFDNCIIEYGDVRGNSSPASYGGGIYTDFNSITISNCQIQHNKAEWGGGIFINQNKSISIVSSIIYDNFSKEGGGGIYSWNGSSPNIENSIFDSNHCDGTSASYYTGGGFAAQSGCSASLYNCTFVNNTSSRTEGQSLMFYGSSNNKAVNCILWGIGSHLYLSGTYSINYCAIQGSAPSGTGNFVLNYTNNATDGPNFTTEGSDWSIKFVSPCRDAGTSSGAPATDYLGNPRIGNYDIGAYEVQYSRWTGATSDLWATATNWESSVDPSTGTGDVIIPSGLTNYPTGSSSQDFTIPAGKYMILNPGAKATFNNLTTTGTLKLESDASGISSLITNNAGATANVELYLTGGGAVGSYKWHYISIPFTTNVPVSTFTGVTFDIAGYNEPRVSTDVMQGWIGYDGWIYSAPNNFDAPYAFSNLVSGRGYEFWDNNTNKFTISGTLNTADVSPVVTFKTGGIDAVNGYNLIGNPFPSGLDWNYIIAQSNFPANTSKSLYFTLDNHLASYISGVGVPAGVNGFIPPMQGFMTKTYDSDHTIVLAAAARTHSLHSRYKGLSVIPLVRLSLAEESATDETVVRFDDLAKAGFDYDFDAVKMSVSPADLLIYSSSGGTNYVINGQPYPETSIEIHIVINLKKDGTHTISATELQGLDSYNVELVDNTTGFTANLKTTPVLTFSASAGSITGRFILRVGKVLTATENPVVSKNIFNIYNGNNLINIQTIADAWDGKSGSVRVMDLTGKTITDIKNAEFRKNSVIQISSPQSKGLYVVEIRSGLLRYVGKVVVR